MQQQSVVPPLARRGRLVRLTVAVLVAGALLACVPAVVDAGTFTQVLCANPATGAGALPDRQLPDGMDNPSDFATMGAAAQSADCGGAPWHNGIHVPTSATTGTPHEGAALTYRAGPDLLFREAKVYRSWWGSTRWGLFTHQGPSWDFMWAAPFEDRCTDGCLRLGNGTPFSSENVKTIVGSTALNGFNLSVLCNATAELSCQSDNNGLRFYGATVVLEDAHNPQVVGTPSGSLTSASVLRGAAEVTLNGSDIGAGLYRVRLVSGSTHVAQIVDAHGGRCADLDPGDGDPYQFAARRPCKPIAGGTYAFDTTRLPEGEQSVRVLLEDAAGNTTTVLGRSVTVDNVPPPSLVTAGTLTGATRRGSGLALTVATWNDHGADGEPTLTRVWQRCRRNGSACEDIPGAAGTAHVLTDADLNRRIRVVETATTSEGSTSAVSDLTGIVTREDGSLPPDNDDLDNDGDGQIDEPGETWPGPVGPSGAGGSRAGQAGADGANGRDGASAVAASMGAVNGEGASRRAKVSVDATRPVLPFGRTATISGKLVDDHGRPIRNAVLDVAETPALTGARTTSGQPVTTGADGAFRYTATGAAGTRRIVFAYRYERDGDVVSEADALLTVKAGVGLSVRLRGAIASYRGKVLAGAMPRGGKLVIVQGRVKGGSWQTFASRRAARTGVFKGRYRLRVRRPGRKLQFRVRVLAESGWNFRGVTSKAVTRTVR